jgi:pimeloyl-ACP methyl ester carboxylesterase
MNMPEWTKPALYGAVAGAAALAVVGFSWGGWVTGGTAQELAEKASIAAVAAAMTPYCVEMANADPRSAELLAELKMAKGYSGRMVIEKAGWATPSGAEEPNSALATACQTALSASNT